MSLSAVSLIAIVPESECMMPTLIVSAASTGAPKERPAAVAAAMADRRLMKPLRCNDMSCFPALLNWKVRFVLMEPGGATYTRTRSTVMLHCTTHAKVRGRIQWH